MGSCLPQRARIIAIPGGARSLMTCFDERHRACGASAAPIGYIHPHISLQVCRSSQNRHLRHAPTSRFLIRLCDRHTTLQIKYPLGRQFRRHLGRVTAAPRKEIQAGFTVASGRDDPSGRDPLAALPCTRPSPVPFRSTFYLKRVVSCISKVWGSRGASFLAANQVSYGFLHRAS